jgi:hypothetical protein
MVVLANVLTTFQYAKGYYMQNNSLPAILRPLTLKEITNFKYLKKSIKECVQT